MCSRQHLHPLVLPQVLRLFSSNSPVESDQPIRKSSFACYNRKMHGQTAAQDAKSLDPKKLPGYQLTFDLIELREGARRWKVRGVAVNLNGWPHQETRWHPTANVDQLAAVFLLLWRRRNAKWPSVGGASHGSEERAIVSSVDQSITDSKKDRYKGKNAHWVTRIFGVQDSSVSTATRLESIIHVTSGSEIVLQDGVSYDDLKVTLTVGGQQMTPEKEQRFLIDRFQLPLSALSDTSSPEVRSGRRAAAPRSTKYRPPSRVRAAHECLSSNAGKARITKSLRAIWNLEQSKRSSVIAIICSDTRKGPRPPKSSDYSYCTSFGDIDSLIEVLVHLARLFPTTVASKYPASAVSSEQKRLPLTIIGGPIGEEGRGGNITTQFINSRLPRQLHYAFEGTPRMQFGDRDWKTEYDPTDPAVDQAVVRDAGMIIRCPNPWNARHRTLVFQGTHTYGVLGAVRALTDPAVAHINADRIVQTLGLDPCFCMPITVAVDAGCVLPPLLSINDLIPWDTNP
jgi:hypothetical protein